MSDSRKALKAGPGAGGETTEDFYDKKTFPSFPTTMHITALVLLIGLIICMVDCTMSVCSGNLFPLEEKHQTVKHPFDL